MGRRLRDACFSLADFPDRNRVGSIVGARENVAVWPYVIVYRVSDAVQILRGGHGDQDRVAD